jgi:acetyl esterase/lipase
MMKFLPPFLASLSLSLSVVKAEDAPAALPLWLHGAPGSEARVNEPEKVDANGKGTNNVSNVHNPSITPYLPTKGATGIAVIIAPGGGHSKLCLGHEGGALAEWFRDHGVAAFVLKYRLAREPGSTYTIQDHAMADARRAIRTVRSRAAEWGIDPQKIGIMGFSAGGELAAFAAMENDPGKADAEDVIERASSRPDFQALIYPGTSDLFSAKKGMPPVFIACGFDDRKDISEGMATLYLKYKAAGVKAELHIFSGVGHGFGYRPDRTNAAGKWPERFMDWMEESGFIEPKEK